MAMTQMSAATRKRGRARSASKVRPGSKKMPVSVSGVDICGPSASPAWGGVVKFDSLIVFIGGGGGVVSFVSIIVLMGGRGGTRKGLGGGREASFRAEAFKRSPPRPASLIRP